MSITRIYENYEYFSQRKNKTENGVSVIFSIQNPNWEQDNKTNEGCWNCSRCSRCSECYGCYDCSDCSRCSACHYCYDCYQIAQKSEGKELKGALQKENTIAGLKVPVIDNIHQTIRQQVSNPDSLDMSSWHTCDTTHCRAGWVVFLAGKEGMELETKTSTEFAALQIYKASSEIKVSPVRFYEPNEVAMADINRCAEEESKLQTN